MGEESESEESFEGKGREEGIEDEESEEEIDPHCFEDNPMPILKGFIAILENRRKVKILIDSGAAINLVSREIAEEFRKAGGKF